MHHPEQPEHEPCVTCGRDVAMGTDRTYVVTDDEVLCFDCAVRLGGSWDEITGTWLQVPDVRGTPLHRDHVHR
jgi:hypothetical protein